MKSKHYWLLLIISFLLFPLSLAQQESGPNVSLKIDFVAWGDQLPPLTVKDGKKQVTIKALPFTYSTPINYSGSNVLEFYQASGTSAADGIPPALVEMRKQKPGLVGLATLPLASKRVTVLIAPAGGGTYQTYVIDDDPSKLPYGNLRIHNYSSDLVAFICNGKKTEPLKSGQAVTIPPVDGLIVYEIGYLSDGKWQIQEKNVLRMSNTEQVQMVVLKSDNKYFISGDGLRSGFLQNVVLRRPLDEPKIEEEVPKP